MAAAAERTPSDSTRVFRTPTSRYRLQRQLARGSAASVWLARDAKTDAEVVLKKLEPASIGDPLMRRRLEVEAQASDTISHPGVVPVIDRVFGEEAVGIVFPWVPGETLRERLSRVGPLDARTSASIAVDVADVLSAAHALGLIHRDVKPANILLGDDGRVRLLDFGIARSVGIADDDNATPEALEATGAGMAIGTLPYMAPEQLTGGEPSPRTDVYALGVVLYETLSGSRPYTARSPSEQLALLQEAPPMIADAPPALWTLALQAMSLRPEQRPTAAQFGRALRGWLDGRDDAETATKLVAVPGPQPVSQPAPAASASYGPGAPVAVVAGGAARRAGPVAAMVAGLILVAVGGVALALIAGMAGPATSPSAPPVSPGSEQVVQAQPSNGNDDEPNRDHDNGGRGGENRPGEDGGNGDEGRGKGNHGGGNGGEGHGNGGEGGGNGGEGGGNGDEGGGNGDED